MLYSIFYSLYIIATVVFGGVYIAGPFTIRHIAVAMMIVYAMTHSKSLPKEKAMAAYILFIVCLGISDISYGYTESFFKYLFAHYLVCYVSYWATLILIEKTRSIATFIYTFTAIGIASGALVMLQYHDVYWAFIIPDILRTFTEEDMEQLSSFGGLIEGQSLPGLFNRVDNGYYIAIATIASLYFYSKSRKIITLCAWLFLLVSLYMVQQRAALFIGLFLSIVFLVKELSRRQILLILILVAMGGFAFLYQNSDIISTLEDSRYMQGADTSSRHEHWNVTIDYIMENPLNANGNDFDKKHPTLAAHNLFLNAYLSCGLIGGSIVLFVFTILCYRSFKVYKIRDKIRPEYYLTTLAFLSFNFISLTHNNSLVNGNIVFWILATPLMIKQYKLYENKNI